MRLLERTAGVLSSVSAFIAGSIMMLMMLQVTLDVLLKHFFNSPVPMTLEMVSSYYMVALIFLPLGDVTRRSEHLEVELFTQHLPSRRLAWFKLFGCVFGLVYVAFMFVQGVQKALKETNRGEVWETATLDLQVWPARWLLPIGCALMFVWLVLQAIDHFYYGMNGRRVIEPPKGHATSD